MDGNNKQTNLHTDNTRKRVSVYRNVFRSWFTKSHDHPKGNRGNKRYRHYKHLLAISGICIGLHPVNAFAEGIGGVSATASPIANSSGSVTNQAIQVLQGPYITNTYGNGISCQGPTRNFTPFVTGNGSWTKPYEGYYNSPVYDMRDLDDDGAPDNPGDILYHVPTRTGQKDNYSLSMGFSMTWSTPLDKELQQQCKDAVATQIALQNQQVANKRLDFEIARLKNCGELLKAGISFHPKSPYYSVCADVVVQNVNNIAPHAHSIPKITPPPKVSNDASVLKEVSIGYGK
tara:strand:- start:31 stop:897 length:867 start_codon:yes stop_codon:yes gene_type:complete